MSANSGTGRAGTLTCIFSSAISDRADLAAPPADPLGRGQFGKPHRAAGMQFLGGDADLGAEPELLTVGEARRGVDHNGSRIDAFGETLRRSHIGRHDSFGVPGAVSVDVGNGRVD